MTFNSWLKKVVNIFVKIQITIGGRSTESPRKQLFSIKYVIEEMLENLLH